MEFGTEVEIHGQCAMIYVGIDDTDMPETPGTNQLARALIADIADQFRCVMLLRHQLLDDPRVPYTSKNGSASIQLEPINESAVALEPLIRRLRERMLAWYVPGSDPGLCVTTVVPDEVTDFGRQCQTELVTRDQAERLATRYGVFLEGLGGTRGGMIGALAAVGLAASRNDGRVVVNGTWPDDLAGRQHVPALGARGVAVQCLRSGAWVGDGQIDVGKHLRPNVRSGKIVLFVEPAVAGGGCDWQAVRLT